jgi:hypothetical protein
MSRAFKHLDMQIGRAPDPQADVDSCLEAGTQATHRHLANVIRP